MKKLYVLITSIFIATTVQNASASNLVRVMAIGSSPRGQFVAFEEFGYKNERKTAYSRIRVMNMWQNKYVYEPSQVIGNTEENNLRSIRTKAKSIALENLKKYNISL